MKSKITIKRSSKFSLEQIRHVICTYYCISKEDLFSKGRQTEIVKHRQNLHYLCYKYTLASLRSIGDLTKQDHSTVLNSVSTVSDHIDTEPEYAREIADLELFLNACKNDIRNFTQKLRDQQLIFANDFVNVVTKKIESLMIVHMDAIEREAELIMKKEYQKYLDQQQGYGNR